MAQKKNIGNIPVDGGMQEDISPTTVAKELLAQANTCVDIIESIASVVGAQEKMREAQAKFAHELATFLDVAARDTSLSELKNRIMGVMGRYRDKNEIETQLSQIKTILETYLHIPAPKPSKLDLSMNRIIASIKTHLGISQIVTYDNMSKFFDTVDFDTMENEEIISALDDINGIIKLIREENKIKRLEKMKSIIISKHNKRQEIIVPTFKTGVINTEVHLRPWQKVGKALGLEIDDNLDEENCYTLFNRLPVETYPKEKIERIIMGLSKTRDQKTQRAGKRYDFTCKVIKRCNDILRDPDVHYPPLVDEPQINSPASTEKVEQKSTSSNDGSEQRRDIIRTMERQRQRFPIAMPEGFKVTRSTAELRDIIEKQKEQIKNRITDSDQGGGFYDLHMLNLAVVGCGSMEGKAGRTVDDLTWIKQQLEEIQKRRDASTEAYKKEMMKKKNTGNPKGSIQQTPAKKLSPKESPTKSVPTNEIMPNGKWTGDIGIGG